MPRLILSLVTTVGYGDLYPTTVAGRLIGMGLMLVGSGFISVPTATGALLGPIRVAGKRRVVPGRVRSRVK